MRMWGLVMGLGLAGVAVAHDVEVDPATGRPIEYERMTHLIFEADLELSAEIARPALTPLVDQRAMQFPPMVVFRTNFDPELRSTAHDIR